MREGVLHDPGSPGLAGTARALFTQGSGQSHPSTELKERVKIMKMA